MILKLPILREKPNKQLERIFKINYENVRGTAETCEVHIEPKSGGKGMIVANT